MGRDTAKEIMWQDVNQRGGTSEPLSHDWGKRRHVKPHSSKQDGFWPRAWGIKTNRDEGFGFSPKVLSKFGKLHQLNSRKQDNRAVTGFYQGTVHAA